MSETEQEKNKASAKLLTDANVLVGLAIEDNPSPESIIASTLVNVLTIIACELHEINTTLKSMNKES